MRQPKLLRLYKLIEKIERNYCWWRHFRRIEKIKVGLKITPNALIAAGSVVHKEIPPNTCVVGVPARICASLHQYIQMNIEQSRKGSVFNSKEIMHPVPSEIREKIKKTSR